MAQPDARRTDLLRVLVSGVDDDPIAATLALAAIDALSGRTPDLPELDDEGRAIAHEFADQHRVRSIVNRLLPGAGGESIAALAGAVALERRLIEAVGVLTDGGVEVLVLKGSATAHLDHGSPSDREVGDVDLLVPVDRLDVAIEVLERAGYTRKVTHPFRTFTHFHSETILHPDGTELDIHTRLAQSSRTPRTCWDRPDRFTVGGRTMHAMPAEWRFLHALVHQMMNPPPSFRGLNGLLDLVVLTPRVDLAKVRAAADEVHLRALTELGLERVAALLGQPSPARLDAGGRLERRLAAAFDGNDPVPGYVSLAANLSVLPVRRWPSFVGQLLWPAADYRAELGVTPLAQVSHVIREALGRPSGTR